jgi:outer membrane protein insertion porin family
MSSSASASRSDRRARRAARLLALALVLAWAGAQAGAAQDAAVVDRIAVRVDGRPGEAGLLDLIPLRPGDAFSPRLVDQAVKQIFSTGLFADVRVTREGEGRIALVFDLVRKVFIDDVFFRGPKVSATPLREGLTSQRPGAYLQEDRLPEAIEEVREGLKRAGFFDAVVVSEIKRKEGASTADIVFRAVDWKTFRIGGLEVEWKAEIPERSLLRKMKSRVGDLYVPNRLAADLEALSQGLGRAGYRRAEVRLAGESFDDENRRVDLRIEILPQEKITIVVNGAKVPLRILEPIWKERVFEQWGLSEGEARILNHLRRQGYLFATVQSRVEKPSGEVRIIHDVTRGEKSKITAIDFRGNAAYSNLDLKNRLAVREGIPFFSLLRYDRLFTIPREVESFYKENGFADIQVRLELVRQAAGVQAVFDVREGPKTTVEAIRIEGASLIPAEELARDLVNRAEGPFFPPNVQRDVSQIEAIYLNRGFRGSEVTASVERPAAGRVSLVYEITEGTPVTVRDVFVTGSRTTRNRVIRREILVGPGSPADFSLVQETKRRLENLGIFSEVRVDEIQTGPGNEVVVVTVREGEKNYAGLGLGFESEDPLTGSLANWPGNPLPRGSAEYIRNNVFGLGAQVGVLGQIALGQNPSGSGVGIRELRTVLSWSQPHLLGLAIPTTILVWAEREARDWGPPGSELVSSLDRRGISFSAVKALSRSRLLLGSLSVTRTSLKNVLLADLPDDIDRRFLPYSAALASLSMSWERRDDTLNPTRGYFLSAVGEVGVPVFGKRSSQPGQEDPNPQSDYQKIFLKGQFYQPISSGLNLGMTARLGLGHGLRNLPEFFFAGGSNTFRGEEFERLGPFDPTTFKPVGGAAVLLLNTELTFPIFPSWKALRFASFLDLGNVYANLGDFRPFKLQGAAGAGIRYRTPLGPVRVEIAWKLWGIDDQDKKGKPLIFLTIGGIF